MQKFTLQNHRHLPEAVVVTGAGLNPALKLSFCFADLLLLTFFHFAELHNFSPCRPFQFCCTCFSSLHVNTLHVDIVEMWVIIS